jgi:hypothetical protein
VSFRVCSSDRSLNDKTDGHSLDPFGVANPGHVDDPTTPIGPTATNTITSGSNSDRLKINIPPPLGSKVQADQVREKEK